MPTKYIKVPRFLARFFERTTSLEVVLLYNNEFVIRNFLKHYDVTEQEAQELFKETLKWLWLCANNEGSKRINMLSSMRIVDEMWHTFILCTWEYETFCHTYFGKFIHHVPSLDNEMLSDKDREEMLTYNLSYVYDKLGAETVIKWYSHYPNIYPVEKIPSLRKN